MRTLKDIKCNQSVSVVKLHGEGGGKTQNHGYGHYKRNTGIRQKGSASGRPGRGDGAGL